MLQPLKRFFQHYCNRAGIARRQGGFDKSMLISIVAVLLVASKQVWLLVGAWIPQSGPVSILAVPVAKVLLAVLLIYIVIWHEEHSDAGHLRYAFHPFLRLISKVLLPSHIAASLWLGILALMPAYTSYTWEIAKGESRKHILNSLKDKHFVDDWGITKNTPWELYCCRFVLRDRERASLDSNVFINVQLEKPEGQRIVWAGPQGRDISWEWGTMTTAEPEESMRWEFDDIPDSFEIRMYAIVAWDEGGDRPLAVPLRRLYIDNFN